MTIYFYKELGPLGYLASYSLHGFWKEGVYWKTVEHYYQAHKFEDIVVRAEIIDAQTPKDASSIGRNRSHALRKGWMTLCCISFFRIKTLRTNFCKQELNGLSRQLLKKIIGDAVRIKMVQIITESFYAKSGIHYGKEKREERQICII